MRRLIGAGFYNVAFGFDATEAQSLFGRRGRGHVVRFGRQRRVFLGGPTWATFSGAGWSNRPAASTRRLARAESGGWDMAYFFDSAGDDELRCRPRTMRGCTAAAFRNCGVFFDLMAAYASDGNDTANLTDSIRQRHRRARGNTGPS